MNQPYLNGIRKSSGLTIIELIVTLAVVSAIVSIGIPTMSTLIERNQFKAEASKVHRAISLTRANAVYRSEPVTLCPLESSKQCGTDWDNQLSVFSDINSNGVLDKEESILYSLPALPEDSSVIRTHSRDIAITFRPDGSAFGYNGTVSVCFKGDTELSSTVIVSSVGRIRLGLDTDKDGRAENSDGSIVDCT